MASAVNLTIEINQELIKRAKIERDRAKILLDALEWIADRYEKKCDYAICELADEAYEMRCEARAAIQVYNACIADDKIKAEDVGK